MRVVVLGAGFGGLHLSAIEHHCRAEQSGTDGAVTLGW